MSYLQWDHHQAQSLLRLAQLRQHAPAVASAATATTASSAAADVSAILAGVVTVPPPAEKRLRTTAGAPSVDRSEDPAAACGQCPVFLSELAAARSEMDRTARLLLSERRRAEDAEARFHSFAQSLAAADSPAASTIPMPFLTQTTASAPVSLQGARSGLAGGWTMASAAPLGLAQLTMEAAVNRVVAMTRAGTPGGTAAAFPPSLAASLAKVGATAEQVELAVAPEQQQRLSAAAAAAPPPVRLGGLLVAAARGTSSSVRSSSDAAGNDCGVGGRNSPPPTDAVDREVSDQPGGDGTPSPGTDADANLEQIKRDSGGIVDAYRVLNGKPEATKDKDKEKKMLQDGASENPKKFKSPSSLSTYCSLLSTPRLNPPSLLVKDSAASAFASASAGDDRKRKSPSLPTSTPLATLRAVATAAANAPPAPIVIPFPKPHLPPHHPGSCSNSVSDAAAAESSNISTRRGDPRMNRAVAAKLSNPTCPLLDALLEGGFVFPMNHGERECRDHGGGERNDKTVVDAEGVSLFQRKNQLNRRLRRVKMHQARGLAGGGRVGGSIVDKQPHAAATVEAGAMAQQAG